MPPISSVMWSPRPALLALDVEDLFDKLVSLHGFGIRFGMGLRAPMQETIQWKDPTDQLPAIDIFRRIEVEVPCRDSER
jgi:hypothetical protein